ncbi:MAG: hypothetical protein ACKVOU_05750 [Cytophagales bacterium]
MTLRFFRCIFLLSILPFYASAQKLGFNELSVGVDARTSKFYEWSDFKAKIAGQNAKYANYLGVSGRFSTSFLALCYAQKFTKWRVADVLIGEVGLGLASSNYPSVKGGFFPTYDFTIGFGGIYRINQRQDIGINFGMLRFARSLQTKNFSGCNIYLKYRIDKFLVEFGLESWYEFYLSWIYILNSRPNPLQFTVALKYAFNEKQMVGFRLENNSIYDAKPHFTEFGKEYYWNLRLFYGIYF